MSYAAFSFYPFESIRVIRGQKNLRKPQRLSSVAARDADFYTARDFRKCREDRHQSGKGRIRRGESGVSGRPVGNAVPEGIAMSRRVPVIAPEDHFAPASGVTHLQCDGARQAVKRLQRLSGPLSLP
jgi:hypothetical protein